MGSIVGKRRVHSVHLLQDQMAAGVGMDYDSFCDSSRCGTTKYLMALGVAWGPLLAAFTTGSSSISRLAVGCSLYVSSSLGRLLPCMKDDDLIHSQSRAVQLEMV